jgi:uncharacterized protein (TIGR03435 family)
MRPLFLLLMFAFCCVAQNFEVATVKPSARGDRGPELDRLPDGLRQQERYTARGLNLYEILGIAYAAVDPQQISGPGWIRSENFEISAKFPPDTTKEQFQTMLQNLLIERFKLKLHHETKMLPVYELTVLKSGHKLLAPGTPAPVTAEGLAFPDVPPDRPGFRFTGARLAARQQPIATLTGMIRTAAGRLIIDKTGLKGTYDYWLEFNPRALLGQDDSIPDVFTALQQQLGLKLVDAEAPFDVVVIDSGDKIPGEN